MYFKVIRTHRMYVNRCGDVVADSHHCMGYLWIELAPPNGKGMAWFKSEGYGPDIALESAWHRWLNIQELMVWTNSVEYIFYIEREATKEEFERVHRRKRLNKNGIQIL